jgi:hypothetical protein
MVKILSSVKCAYMHVELQIDAKQILFVNVPQKFLKIKNKTMHNLLQKYRSFSRPPPPLRCLIAKFCAFGRW